MKKLIFRFAEIILAPFTYLSLLWLKTIKRYGLDKAVVSEKIFMSVGVLPVRDHYYDPLINPRKYLKVSLREDRALPGVNFNDAGQLQLLKNFNYNEELLSFPFIKRSELEYAYDNESFKSGDSEFLYSIIRHFKPRRIIEIGSGQSTLIAVSAIKKNKLEDGEYACEHICIEPYEQPWLEKLDAKIIRKKVEEIEAGFFTQLQQNDILFVDSSHIIRPQGDVLYEYLEILPQLNAGVLVHIHDIFSPKDYLDEWIYTNHWLWNEQYLLEAFLTFNDSYEVIGALNYLQYHYPNELFAKCPALAKESGGREPGSFWIRRI